MNPYTTRSNARVVSTVPLFSSVWLALFCVLRKNFNAKRPAAGAGADRSPPGG